MLFILLRTLSAQHYGVPPPTLYTRVPLLALIFPIPTLPATNASKRLHQFDHHHILGLLVAELSFEAEMERRAVRYIEGITVELIGQDRLRVITVGQVHALVVGHAFIVHIGAMEDGKLG